MLIATHKQGEHMMRSDDVVQLDNGPRVKKMTRLAVSYLADREGVPQFVIYQRAFEALLADFDWTAEELADYYGKRAVDLDKAMHEMKGRGIKTRRDSKRGGGGLKAA
jgi:hypothetical protein